MKQKLKKILLAGALALPLLVGAQTNSFKPFTGCCYGPFRNGESPNWGIYPTTNEIAADMPIIKNFCSQIRTYGTENNLFYIPREANKFGIGFYAGAWIDNAGADSTQLTDLARIGNLNYPTTRGLVVGNEYLYRHPTDFAKLTNSIAQVRNAVTNKTIKVGAAEQWHVWRDYPTLANSVDFMMVHVHPYWEGQNVTNAANFVVEKYNLIKSLNPGKKIIIGETGWPTVGATIGEAVPSTNNQERFFKDFRELARTQNIDYLMFSMFNEAWKASTGEGVVGGNWGIMDENRNLKSSMENILQSETKITSISPQNISFRSYESGGYILERKSSLLTNNWTTVTNLTGAVGTNLTTLAIPKDNSPTGFYRLKFKYK
jgi:exo-beta-1,3-glucanase (GH17 family)